MKISLNNVWLTNDGASDLRAWTDAHGVQFNGRQVVQDAQFLRAVAAQPIARGNAVVELQFTVTRQHTSAAAASTELLTAFGTLPTGGTATIICGALGETPVTCSFSAVLVALPQSRFCGRRTETTFVLRGGPVTVIAGVASGVDAGPFDASYSFAAGGTLDGGNFADALVPAALNLDGGAFA